MMPRIATMRTEIGIVSQKARRAGGEEREHDRLGRVGDRRQVVAREDGKRLGNRQSFLGLLVAREWSSEEKTSGAGIESAERLARVSGRRSSRDRPGPRIAEVRGEWPGDPDAPVAWASTGQPMTVGTLRRRLGRSRDRRAGARPEGDSDRAARASIEREFDSWRPAHGRGPRRRRLRRERCPPGGPGSRARLQRGRRRRRSRRASCQRRSGHAPGNGRSVDSIHASNLGLAPKRQRPPTGLADAQQALKSAGPSLADPVADARLGDDQAARRPVGSAASSLRRSRLT